MAKKKKKKVVKKKNVNTKNRKKTSNAKKKKTDKKNLNSKSIAKNQLESNKKIVNTKEENSKKNNVEKNKKSKKIENIKKKEKKSKLNIKLLIITFIMLVLCVVVILFISNNINNRKVSNEFLSINFDEYLDLYEKDSLEFVYLYHSSCINCDNYEERLIKLEKEFDIQIKMFNYSKLNESDLSILKSSNNFLEDGIEVPTIIAIKNGVSINSISGIKEYSALKNFVSLSKEDGINKFNKINVDEYLSILNSKEKSLIYICDSSESCNKFSALLDKVSTDRKIKVNYLNTEIINSSDDWAILESSNKMFEKMWFMPVIMVVKDNKVIDYKMETLSEKDLNKFLKKNGL